VGRESELWRQVEALAEAKRPKEYDHAARLVRDLRDLGVRQDSLADFDRRVAELRRRHAKQPSFIGRIEHVTSTPGS
jgi:cation transport regulator ChaC